MQTARIPISDLKKPRATPKGRQIAPQVRAEIVGLLGEKPRDRQYLIEYLHLIQDANGHISADHIAALAQALKLSQVEVYEVATFYHHFDVLRDGDAAPPAHTVRICASIACAIAGGQLLFEDLKNSCGADVRVMHAPCVGQCDHAPMAVVDQVQIKTATPQKIAQALTLPRASESTSSSIPAAQISVPEGAFSAFKNFAEGGLPLAQLIATMKDANLRGLGGAGFAAGRKWEIVRSFEGPRAMVVNADEGEPGTFKDRYYLERNPWQFWEGVLIAAWAVEAQTVYVYLRDEYHDLRRAMEAQLTALQMHFPALAASPYRLPQIEMRRGAGAYICGEESALIESVEGKRGIPRLRPPYIAQAGVFGQPTLAHNVETLYWIPEILRKGAAWWRGQGRNGRNGLRSYSVSGRVKTPGVKLAPAGISLHELIDEFCDGMLAGHSLYAYLPGGASGGILPASLANVPLDFDTLQAHDAFIGSAAIVVLSQRDRVRDAALNLMQFFEHESCGQCTPCRVGTRKAAVLMAQENWDEKLLSELSQTMIDASICGLGQAAPNPLLTAMKYFPQEFAR